MFPCWLLQRFAILKMCQSAFSVTSSGVLSVLQKEEKKKKPHWKMGSGHLSVMWSWYAGIVIIDLQQCLVKSCPFVQ